MFNHQAVLITDSAKKRKEAPEDIRTVVMKSRLKNDQLSLFHVRALTLTNPNPN